MTYDPYEKAIRRTLADPKIAATQIVLGGVSCTVAEAVAAMRAEGQSTRAIDYFVGHALEAAGTP